MKIDWSKKKEMAEVYLEPSQTNIYMWTFLPKFVHCFCKMLYHRRSTELHISLSNNRSLHKRKAWLDKNSDMKTCKVKLKTLVVQITYKIRKVKGNYDKIEHEVLVNYEMS